jgi:hypothetical protein
VYTRATDWGFHQSWASLFGVRQGGPKSIGAISAAPYGSSAILPIPYVYIKLMGAQGLRKATEVPFLWRVASSAAVHALLIILCDPGGYP